MLAEHASMGIAYVNGQVTALAATAALLFTVSLGGCATSTARSSLMDAWAEIPTPPKASGYLPVEDLPQNRQIQIMTADEQSRLKKELIAAHDRQAAAAKASYKSTEALRTQPVRQ
jgi:hypothetical protein